MTSKPKESKLLNETKTEPKFQLSPTVELVKYEDITILSDWVNGKFFGLDSLTARIFQGIIEGKIYPTINEIYNLYDVSPEQVEKDTEALVKDLLNNKIIQVENSEKFSIPKPFLIRLLLILACICYQVFGLLLTIRLWRCFHHPIPCQLPEEKRDQLIEKLSIIIQEECAKTFPFNVDCKERAIVGWTILRSMGLPAELILAAQYYPFAMHAWSECFGIIIGDNEKRCSYWIRVKKFS